MRVAFLFVINVAFGFGFLPLSVADAEGKNGISAETFSKLKEIVKDEKLLEEFVDNIPEIRSWIYNSYVVKDVRETLQPRASTECAVCRIAMTVGLTIVRSENFTLEPIKEGLVAVCTALNIPEITGEMCEGIVMVFGDHLVEIVRYNQELTPLEICRTVIGGIGTCDGAEKDYFTVTIPGNKPALENRPLLPNDTPTVKILHITDVHPDLHYVEGSDAYCGEYMCCRADNAAPEKPEDAAGYHGHYNCDMPQHAVNEVINHAAEDEYDFVIMTGDLVHHAIWSTSIDDNKRHFDAVNKPLIEKFPGKRVYPVLGNHEPHPCNLFVPPSHWENNANLSLAWMYDHIADTYKDTLPSEAVESFRTKGVYSVLHRDGLRIIALNTNLGYNLNFWLLSDLSDQEGQLQWLAEELEKAEKEGEKVYILGHVPPGSVSCWPPWNREFNKIILRFEATVIAQFYGHTHNDEIKIFFDPKDGRAVNSLYIGASATPLTNLNPGYKVFHADGSRNSSSTWEILDHETFIYNLSLANSKSKDTPPEWYRLYSAREDFGLESLRPEALYDLVIRMLFNGPLFQKFRQAFYKDSHVVGDCTKLDCKMYLLCQAVTADSGDNTMCEKIKDILAGGTPPTTTTEANGANSNLSARFFMLVCLGTLKYVMS